MRGIGLKANAAADTDTVKVGMTAPNFTLPSQEDKPISLSDFKSDASQWLKQLQEDRNTVVLTQNGRGSAVVQSYDSFQRQQQSLAMLKLMAQGEADIRNGDVQSQDAVFAAVRRRLGGGNG